MASTIAAFPVMLLFILNRVLFPAFSRTLNDRAQLDRLFGISIRLCNAFVAPLAIFILIMVEPFTLHIFGEKWVGETTNFSYLLWPTNFFLPTMVVCTSLLNAFGFSKTVLKFNLLLMVLTLGLGTPLIFAFGAAGFGYANIIVNIMTITVSFAVRKFVNCRIFKEQFLGWLPAVVLAVIPLAFRYFFVMDIKLLALSIICYYILSTALTYFVCRKNINKIFGKAVQ